MNAANEYAQAAAWDRLWRLIAERVSKRQAQPIACWHCQPGELLPGEPTTAEQARITECPSCRAALGADDVVGVGMPSRRRSG